MNTLDAPEGLDFMPGITAEDRKKREEQLKLQSDVERFLASGGKVTPVGIGESGLDLQLEGGKRYKKESNRSAITVNKRRGDPSKNKTDRKRSVKK